MNTVQLPKSVLIYDIETSTYGYGFDHIEKHKLRFFAAYSYLTNQYYFIDCKDFDAIQSLISQHKFLVGFNNINYDNMVLKNCGFDLNYKLNIDLLKGVRDKDKLIKHKDSILAYHLPNYTLDGITKTLKLVNDETGKVQNMDYTIFNKPELTKEEYDICYEYTIKDIEVTKKLWEWYFGMFDNWGHHLNEKDKNNLKHLSSATSVYAYKVICNKAGLKEEYAETFVHSDKDTGAYVAYPAGEKFEGDIYCLDFASLYPSIMFQCNLYGRNKHSNDGWHGGDKFIIEGYYDDKIMSKVSKTLYNIYKERKQMKINNNPREYGLKIVMNTAYGLLRSNLFKSVYDDVAGNDTCLLGQQFIKLAKMRFKEKGFKTIYIDTDSLYIQLKDDQTKELMLQIKNEIMEEIKSSIPFPKDTFDMDIDFEIDMLHFFYKDEKYTPVEANKELSEFEKEYNLNEKYIDEEDALNRERGLMKKNYLFIYTKKDGTKGVYIKNLGIVKRNNTQCSKQIFWEIMVPSILETKDCKFKQNDINDWIKEKVSNDVNLIAKRFNIKPLSHYKSESNIYAQIHEYTPKDKTNKLGAGAHKMVPNIKFGVGKGYPKYCTIEEYTNNLQYQHLDKGIITRELRYFTKEYVPTIFRPKKFIPFKKRSTQQILFEIIKREL